LDACAAVRVGGEDRAGIVLFFFSGRRRHTRFDCDWSSDVCSSDLGTVARLSNCGRRRTVRRVVINIQGGDESALAIRYSRIYFRSEERRVGKECRVGWWTRRKKKRRSRKPT